MCAFYFCVLVTVFVLDYFFEGWVGVEMMLTVSVKLKILYHQQYMVSFVISRSSQKLVF